MRRIVREPSREGLMRALATAGPRPIFCAAAGMKCLGWEELLSLVTFFAAAKKVTPAPGRGNANRPTRKQVSRKQSKSKASKDSRLIDQRTSGLGDEPPQPPNLIGVMTPLMPKLVILHRRKIE